MSVRSRYDQVEKMSRGPVRGVTVRRASGSGGVKVEAGQCFGGFLYGFTLVSCGVVQRAGGGKCANTAGMHEAIRRSSGRICTL